jgi:hypothetical protein
MGRLTAGIVAGSGLDLKWIIRKQYGSQYERVVHNDPAFFLATRIT